MTANLSVPYLSQNDNRNNPSGACNVTSMAMCLRFLYPERNWGKTDPDEQLEDFLYRDFLNRGLSRHSPQDISYWFNSVGKITSTFSGSATIEQIKSWLDRGKPCIIHGYLTSFGHIIVVKGYNAKGLICNDPYGKHPYKDWTTGEDVLYTYDFIDKTCNIDGIWTHFVA